jgi:hypothetical protein
VRAARSSCLQVLEGVLGPAHPELLAITASDVPRSTSRVQPFPAARNPKRPLSPSGASTSTEGLVKDEEPEAKRAVPQSLALPISASVQPTRALGPLAPAEPATPAEAESMAIMSLMNLGRPETSAAAATAGTERYATMPRPPARAEVAPVQIAAPSAYPGYPYPMHSVYGPPPHPWGMAPASMAMHMGGAPAYPYPGMAPGSIPGQYCAWPFA